MDYSRLFTVALKNRWIAKFIVANLLIGHCFLVFVSANFQFRGASGKMVVAEVLFLMEIHLESNSVSKFSTISNL